MKNSLYEYELFIIRALTNLHPGSGDANYGIVDNLVQRDPIDGLPVIHGSSIKGALREFCKQKMLADGNGQANAGDGMIRVLFGSEPKPQNGSDDKQAGALRFLESFLIGLPLRAIDKPYYMGTSPMVAKRLSEINQKLGLNLGDFSKLLEFTGEIAAQTNSDAVQIEDESAVKLKNSDNYSSICKLLDDEPLAIANTELFKEFCENLPVIARNQLENGESKNLFYEQVLPRETRMVLVIGFPSEHILDKQDKAEYQEHIKRFKSLITSEPLFIGANASIGYGLCEIKPFVSGVKNDK